MKFWWSVAKVSVKRRSSIGEVSVMYRSTIGQVTVVYRSRIGHVPVTYRSSIDGRILYRSTRLSVDYRQLYRSTAGRPSIDSWSTVGRLSTDIAVDIAADISTEATYSTHDPHRRLNWLQLQFEVAFTLSLQPIQLSRCMSVREPKRKQWRENKGRGYNC